MLTYQLRPRLFRHEPGESLTFPANCEVCFHFQPRQPFGDEPDGGRTAVRGVSASLLFNANTGQHTVESNTPLSPLSVAIEEPTRKVCLAGTTLTVLEKFDSLRDLGRTIEGIYFVLPTVLNIPFADPPFIERVDGKIGLSAFRWELAEWRACLRTTTQDRQEEEVANAWQRMTVLAAPHRRRLVAALHYFHVACRIARQSGTAGEFVAEVLLNMSKALEVLFPSQDGTGNTRDAARAGLRALGLSDRQIENDFIPAMALRNEIDVGHAELGLFTPKQLKTIHGYAGRVEDAFRDMFDLLLQKIEAGEVDVTNHELTAPGKRVIELIERIGRAENQSVDKMGA